MIRWAPWEVGLQESTAPQSAGALARLAAAPRRADAWIALWALLAVAEVLALRPVIFETGPRLPAADIALRFVGGSFAACGLVAWRRRPDSRTGPLMVLTGFGFFIVPLLTQLDSALALTVAVAFSQLGVVAFAAVLLTFGRRRASDTDRWLLAGFAFPLLALQLVWMLFLDMPGNLLLVWPNAEVADALDKAQRALFGVACVATALVLATRWRAASRPQRRALLPSVAGMACLALTAAMLLNDLIAGERPPTLEWAVVCSLLLVPAAFLAGLLRSRLARGGLSELLLNLRTTRSPDLRDALARTLGDPGLEIVFWQAETGAFAAPLPAPGGERSVATLARDGRPLAALIYDASLDDDPELVEAVCAGAAIAIENERLYVEAEQRVSELPASRERIVAAGDSERRRLERNLHDGAQQRLLAIAMQLRMLQGRVDGDPAAQELVKSATEELASSMAELRELARGIHPAVLDHGLESALDSLAARSTVATNVVYDADGRLPPPVELAAYFVASEALANIGKYAQATGATVRVTRTDVNAIIEIADDGVGGADLRRGSGLRGLADRVEALDGRLSVVSPPGAGTVVTAELPCAS